MLNFLENPVWNALNSTHAGLALGTDGCKRYPADVAPFLAVADAGQAVTQGNPGEALTFVGVVPACPAGWTVELDARLLQMVADGPVEARSITPAAVALGEADAQAMLDLTAIAFPGYFRARTHVLGTYLGVRVDGRLVAMAGERMAIGRLREVSGVCVHPDFLGRGYARHLVARLQNQHAEQGLTSFLHVSPENAGAIKLYETLGFARHATVALQRLHIPAL
ncbi:MAG: hypothetical protein JWM80_4520 [Cyanobacteria bacterium RYN_339]|nr:hypothetical protein [Cyanobacteria bacterium RYN_339]